MTGALLIATLAVRALVPLGYMPGNLLTGEFAELCPVASAATYTLLGADAAHEHHHGDDATEDSYSDACPIGSSLFFDAIPTLAGVIESRQFTPLLQIEPIGLPVLAAPDLSHSARAPPLS